MAAAQKDQKDEKDQPNNAAVGHSDTLDGSYRGHPLPATDTSADELDLAHTHPIDVCSLICFNKFRLNNHKLLPTCWLHFHVP